MKKTQVLGILLCLISSMSWGAMFPVAEKALLQIDPISFCIIRYGSVSILLIIMLWEKEGKLAFTFEGKGWLVVFFGAMGFTVYNILIFLGQNLMGQSGVMVASIMETMMPIISIFLVWIFKGIAPKKTTFISIFLALFGAILVVTQGQLGFISIMLYKGPFVLLMLAAVIGWCIYTMGGESFKGWSTLRYSTLTCVVGTLMTVVVAIIAHLFHWITLPTSEVIWNIKYEMIFMATLPGIIALLSWNLGVRILTPINGILFINFVPVTTLVIIIMQGRKVGFVEILGAAFVIIALLFNNMLQRKEVSVRSSLELNHWQEQ